MKFSQLPAELQSLLLKSTGLHSNNEDLLPSKLRQWHYSQIFWDLYGKRSRDDMGQQNTAKTATELIHLLNQFILANRSAFYGLKIRNPILIKRPKPPLREQYATYLPEIDYIDQQFLRNPDFTLNGSPIHQSIHTQAKFYVGQLLYAASRFGGLLRVDLLKSLLHQTIYAAPYQHNNVVWYELEAADQSHMIWIPDPVSSTLLPRLLKLRHISNWAEHPAVQQLNIQSCLSYFLKSFGLPHFDELLRQRKERIKKLLKIVEARLSLTHTACHLPVLAGEEANLSLAPEAFRRLLTKATMNGPSHAYSFPPSAPGVPSIHKSKQRKSDKELALLSQPISQSITDCVAVITIVKKKLASSASTADTDPSDSPNQHSLRGLSATIKAMSQSREFALLPITRLLIEWAAFRLTSQSKWSGKLKPSSLISHLGVILKPLTRLFAAHSPLKMNIADLDEYYHEVIDDAPKQQGQMRRAAILRDFHLFLEKEYQLEPSYVCSGFVMRGSKYKALMVDANILLPSEYNSAYQTLLRRVELSKAPDADYIRLILLILGFRCGLRRSEALYLRFEDIQTPGTSLDEVSSLSELLVRPHSARQLKSKSATRRLPLGLLLSKEERDCFSNFLKLRQPKDPSKYLFVGAHADKPLDTDLAFKPLVAVLQEITGDPDFRYHRLRHSFVTWTFWYWQQHKYLTTHPLTPFLSHAVMSHLAEARQQYFLQTHSSAIRGELHAVSSLAGHSSPSITLFHYLHSMQWCYSAENWRHYALHQDATAKLLSMSRRNYFYRLNQIGFTALLAAELTPWCKAPELPNTVQKAKESSPTDQPKKPSGFHEIWEFYQAFLLYTSKAMGEWKENLLYEDTRYRDTDIDHDPNAPRVWASDKKLEPDRFVFAVELLEYRQQKRNRATRQSSENSPPSNIAGYQLPKWSTWHIATSKAMAIVNSYQELNDDEQLDVLKACHYVVVTRPISALNCQFREPAQLWLFVQWLKPILCALPKTYYLNVSIHCHHNIAINEKEKVLIDWQIPEFAGFVVNTQLVAVNDISNVPFADITLRHTTTREVSKPFADIGFTLGMTILYFYDGARLQQQIAPIPITKAMHKEYVARQQRKAEEAKAAEYQRNKQPLFEPTVAQVSGMSDETFFGFLKSKEIDGIHENKQHQPSGLDSLRSSQDNQKSNLDSMSLGYRDEKPKRRSKKTKDN